jgi:hypothetical protein
MFGWFKKKETKNVKAIASTFLGCVGKMIAHSKTSYKLSNPKNLAVFNALVFDDKGNELWSGDIDISLEEDSLMGLAAELNCTIVVYPEAKGRDKRVSYVYKTDGTNFELGPNFFDYKKIGPVLQYDRSETKKQL